MRRKHRSAALVWDFDGTLVDSRYRNLQVTRAIFTHLTGRSWDELEFLRTLASYDAGHREAVNWRRFYRQHLGLDRALTDQAARLWSEYQLRDATPAPVFPGIGEVLSTLQGYPHGIVSQNSRANIRRSLRAARLSQYFVSIVGYEEVPFARQKPDPEGIMMCVRQLIPLCSGYVLFVGDHETDLDTAVNASRAFQELGDELQVISVLAAYSPSCDGGRLAARADFVAYRPSEIVEIAGCFPP